MNEKLSKFGNLFQIKLIASLLSDMYYLNQINDILKPEYFDNEGNQFIVKKIIEYFQSYNSKATPEVMKIYIEKLKDGNPLKSIAKRNLILAYENIDSDDLKIIQQETLQFCKNQVLHQAILDSVELLQLEQYDEIQNIINIASKAGVDKNVGHEYKNHVEDRYNEDPRNPIPTPWPIINQIMDGGLGNGELGIVSGKPGGGKSFLLVNIACAALEQGKNVVFYTLELDAKYVAKRFDTYFTGLNSRELKHNVNEIKQTIAGVKGELIIKYYPTSTASINTLNAHIEKVNAMHFKTDLVIIDYLDLLKSTSSIHNRRDDQVLGDIYKQARGFAGEHQIPTWSASQINRGSGQNDDIIEGQSISGSYEKLMIADFVASMNRTTKDKVNMTGKLHIIKNRFGYDGMSYPAKINFALSRIHIFKEDSEDGKEINEIRGSRPDSLSKPKSNENVKKSMDINEVKRILNSKMKF